MHIIDTSKGTVSVYATIVEILFELCEAVSISLLINKFVTPPTHDHIAHGVETSIGVGVAYTVIIACTILLHWRDTILIQGIHTYL